jgi:hypothetical protein
MSKLVVLSTTLFCWTASADPTVTIKSDKDDVVLNQVTGEGFASAYGAGGSASASSISFQMVCRAPCDRTVAPDFKYFIDGDGMPSSRAFLLPRDGNVTVDVNTGNNALLISGGIIFSLGSALFVSGLVVAPFNGDAAPPLIAIGLPMAAVGLPMFLKGRTTVKLHRTSRVALDLERGAFTF